MFTWKWLKSKLSAESKITVIIRRSRLEFYTSESVIGKDKAVPQALFILPSLRGQGLSFTEAWTRTVTTSWDLLPKPLQWEVAKSRPPAEAGVSTHMFTHSTTIFLVFYTLEPWNSESGSQGEVWEAKKNYIRISSRETVSLKTFLNKEWYLSISINIKIDRYI